MNSKGQTLVLFVVLIPFILALFAFVIDSAYIVRKNTELYGIAKSSLRSVVVDNKSIASVREVILKNDDNIEIVSFDDSSIHLKNSVEPIFGKIVGYDKYNLETKLYGGYDNGEFRIEKGK